MKIEAEEFYGLGEDEQVRRLEVLAGEAIARWEFGDVRIVPVAYRENMTFRVDAGNAGRFALRVHQADYRTDANIRSELDFMRALSEHGVRTPEVVVCADGEPFVVAATPDVPEARQCDLFEWIDGRPLRGAGGGPMPDTGELATIYGEVGRQAALIANAAQAWQRPAGFSRPAWDAEGIFGTTAHLGDFRTLDGVSPDQRSLIDSVAGRLNEDLAAFGETPDRYGLSHGDFLPENIMVCADGIRLIDFDDCGESWFLFDFATALFDLLGSPAFDPSLESMVVGYREHRPLPDEHLAVLPTFFLARALSYLGWSASRSHLKKAAEIAPQLLEFVANFGPEYVSRPRA